MPLEKCTRTSDNYQYEGFVIDNLTIVALSITIDNFAYL